MKATKKSKKANGGGDVACPKCNKNEPEVEIECEVCLRWFHSDCVNVSVLKFQQVVEHNFHWYCPECDVAAVDLHGKMKTLLSENDVLKTQLKSLQDRISQIENNTETLITSKIAEMKQELKGEVKDELKPVIIEEVVTETEERADNDDAADDNRNAWVMSGRRRNTPIPNLQKIIQEEMYERKQIELIKNNLVISGISEAGSQQADLIKAKEIISINLNIEAEIEKVERCGRASEDHEKPRLLKLFMKTPDNRKNILQNAKKLRDSENLQVKEKVYISPDQTKKQQLESKNLRDQLKTKRLQNQDKTYRIKRGVIIELQ